MSVVVTTNEELKDLITSALREANSDPPQALIDRYQLAKAMGVSITTIDRLRKRGMPCVMLGGASPRYALSDCLAWVKEHCAWTAGGDPITALDDDQLDALEAANDPDGGKKATAG